MTTLDISIQRPRGVSHQITDSVRQLILTGTLKPGTKLPPTPQLAIQWKTNPNTIHKALTTLVKEGLLARCPGLGTFVCQREARLTCVGVFDSVAVNESLYSQAVHKALKQELGAAEIEMDVWLDPRPVEQFAEPWPPFMKAAAQREFQAVIVAGTNLRHIQWQRKLPLPTAYHGAPGMPNDVSFDMNQFVDLSLQSLARQGCRSVGLISPIAIRTETGRKPPRFVERFVDVTRDLGMAIRDPWMRFVPHEGALRGRTHDSYGYEQFLKLWSQAERPQGLVVHDDVAARGVILGLQQKQVRVPEELKLALHKNESIDLLCPVPATFVVSSEREVARALIEQVQKQFRGERCEPIILRFRRITHRGSSR